MLEESYLLKVLHYLMAIHYSIGTVQGNVKERLQVIFFPARRDGGYDLIEI